MPGTDISAVEITNVSPHGIWLLTNKEEYFLSFEHFPWFKQSSLENVFHVVEEGNGHFFWPELDIDLNLDIIKNPEKYPLVDKTRH